MGNFSDLVESGLAMHKLGLLHAVLAFLCMFMWL